MVGRSTDTSLLGEGSTLMARDSISKFARRLLQPEIVDTIDTSPVHTT
jgi:hypothetical protein